AACSSDNSGGAGTGDATGDGGSNGGSAPGDDGGPADDGVDVDVTGDPPPGDAIYAEDFEGADGDAWPSPWREIGTAVLSTEVVGGRGRLQGQETTVARVALPGFSETDVDI